MVPRAQRTAFRLSTAVAALAAAASLGGLLAPGLYRDNALVRSAWHGNDLVTLLVAVPALLGSQWLAGRGSGRALLVWLGMLDYTLYTYAFYLFGAAFNALFLVYAALVALSLYALVFGLVSADVEALARAFSPRTPVRAVSAWMLALALALGGLWTAMSLGYVATGRVPEPILQTGHPTGVVFALDLTLLVPALVLGALWLWRRRPWGYVLGALLNVKGVAYPLALALASREAAQAGMPGAGAQVALWAAVTLASLTASVALLAHLQEPSLRRARARGPGQGDEATGGRAVGRQAAGSDRRTAG